MQNVRLRRGIIIISVIISLTWLWFFELQPTVSASDIKEDMLTVDILNTEKSDCIIIRQGDFCMVIDTAYESEQEYVRNYFETNQITQIDYLILTHMDGDHIGNILYFLKNFQIDNLIEPAQEKDTDLYKRYVKYKKDNNIKARHLEEDLNLHIGDLNIDILIPMKKVYERSNDYSIIVSLIYGEQSFLFCGDAEKIRLAELLQYNLGKYSVIKVPHHGQYTTDMEKLVKRIKPVYAVFTCVSQEWVEKNFYKTLAVYREQGTKCLYNTLGDVHFKTDGKTLWEF